ncbi:hypothetical protein [Deinococcus hopiensis]|uniref:Uncharacterized protein n=1 Tax=Deinococcus hopiensis KR-140 TaxID=695939 RepID=A0A1W1UXP0_9DEIO|nr:hypothetical protein [Deinococcus hopiensis]SMB85852.1 hypothetical protein SAMN00790413_03567 [Deinococcus hopiensis KR-140]
MPQSHRLTVIQALLPTGANLTEFERRAVIQRLRQSAARNLPALPCLHEGQPALRVCVVALSAPQVEAVETYLGHLAEQQPGRLTPQEMTFLAAFQGAPT